MRKRTKLKRKQANAEQPSNPTLAQVLDGMIGIAVGLAILYWFFTGMWGACVSWLP